MALFLQVTNGIVDAVLRAPTAPVQVPSGRRFVPIPDTDPQVDNSDYWLGGSVNAQNRHTPAPPPPPPARTDSQILRDIATKVGVVLP